MKFPIIQVFARGKAIFAIVSLVIILSVVVCFDVGCGRRSPGAVWELSEFVISDSSSFNLPATTTTVNIVQGKNLYIKAKIHNIGDTEGDYEWNVLLDNNNDDPIWNKTTTVRPGSTSSVQDPYLSYPTPENITLGVHEVTIGQVTLHFTVIAPHQAEISAVTVVPSCIALLDSNATITGQIRNPGENNEYYAVHLIVDDVVRETKNYSVPRFSTAEFTFFIHNEYNWGCGCHSVLITVDGSESKGTGEFEVGIADCPCTGTCGTASGTGTGSSALTVMPLALTSVALLDGVVGESYTTDAIKPNGGTTPYSYSVTAGNLPEGLVIKSFDNYFRIEGTPTTYGEYDFQIAVNNANETAGEVKAPFKIIIIPNLKGTWIMTTTVTQANGVCAGEGGTSSEQITITQNGRKVTFSGILGNPNIRLNGEILPPKAPKGSSTINKEWVNDTTQWVVIVAGDYPEDGGTTSSIRRLTINTVSNMSGVEDWTWIGGGGDCPDGKGEISVTKTP